VNKLISHNEINENKKRETKEAPICVCVREGDRAKEMGALTFAVVGQR